jgi:hypothetical protein
MYLRYFNVHVTLTSRHVTSRIHSSPSQAPNTPPETPTHNNPMPHAE